MANPAISNSEFEEFRSLIYERAGINLSPAKKSLVVGRLSKRLREHGMKTFGDYYRMVTSGEGRAELQTMVDLLTTNETYFFREPGHFDFLRERIVPELRQQNRGTLKFWSAACSSGDEVYTLAMVLEDALGKGGDWSIYGTDISTRVVARARRAVYPMAASERIPRDYLRRYCLKGTGSQEGLFLIDRPLRQRCSFDTMNLNATEWADPGRFDVILLRNVMIYFDVETKRRLVARLAESLRPNGWLIVGHSETLNAVSDRFEVIRPSVYRRRD